jgi:NAD(P)H dehydrogenase (quinone)
MIAHDCVRSIVRFCACLSEAARPRAADAAPCVDEVMWSKGANVFVILGGNGKIGRATIAELRRLGAPVRAVVRDPSAAAELGVWGCEVVAADLRDAAALEMAMVGATAVQVICPTSVRADDASSDMEAIIRAIVHALDRVRPRAVVAISDYGAQLGAGTGIALTFHYLEVQLRRIPSSLTLLRSAEHMQNWSRLVSAAAKAGILPSLHHPVTKLFPTVSAPDVGLIAAHLLTVGGEAAVRIVHAEGPRRYSARDVAGAVGDLAGREITAVELPRSDWVRALVRGGLGTSYAELVAAMYDAHNAGRIDVEGGIGEIRRGRTELREALSLLTIRS